MHITGPAPKSVHPTQAPASLRRARPRLLAAASLACLALAGCRTPGPLHAYLHTPAAPGTADNVLDVNPSTGAPFETVPACTKPGEQVLGIAYDPFTDHFYLRLSPGNRVRVVDRPAAAMKREFTAPALPEGGHDLAVRQRDRHLFFTDPTGPALLETSIYGVLRSRIVLAGLDAPAWGVACDERDDLFLILPAETTDLIRRFSRQGAAVGDIKLARQVRGQSLAFDSEHREFFAALADGSGLGVFAEDGRLLRTLPATSPRNAPASDAAALLIDVGPRSFIRIF
ncbi:MAG: hypothetical protein RIQ79_955 [Verrucomicrobiota bacterium]